MFGKQLITDMISRSAENEADRRVFLKSAGLAGMGAVGAAAVGGGLLDSASAAGETATQKATDAAVLNFALNLEYLEAEFYLNAVFGHGLNSGLTGGQQKKGKTIGGAQVPFKTKAILNYAKEIAMDELDHVKFLRKALGHAKVAKPQIDLQNSFTAAAQAAGVVPAGTAFNPFADEVSFLLGAFIFEDVGVTAYKGAAPLVTNKAYLTAAAGILAVEAYHAGIVRTTLYNIGLQNPSAGIFDTVQKISAVRDAVDGNKHYDRGIGNANSATLVPTNKQSIAFSRSADQVLNIVYLTPKSVKRGGFFPQGVNGAITKSGGK